MSEKRQFQRTLKGEYDISVEYHRRSVVLIGSCLTQREKIQKTRKNFKKEGLVTSGGRTPHVVRSFKTKVWAHF